jgi:hypothetical protein
MDISNKNTLRFFIYWKGEDIDLSASFHDENFKKINEIAYYNLNENSACHSGDIINAPNGASEFVDIDITKALENDNVRYLVMNVMVFAGPTFKEHEECFAGWMSRNAVNSNEIYEPKTVEQKIDLRSDTRNSIPVIFDLKERKVIWTDINTSGRHFSSAGMFAIKGASGNNVENNKADIEDMCEAFTNLDNKISLYELFELHIEARGQPTEFPAEADTVVSMDTTVYDNDNATVITPFDIAVINSEYMA